MINVFTNSKKIIDTGSVIQFENEDLVFNIEDLQFRLIFKSDGGKVRLESEISEDEMKLLFYNYDNSFGIGTSSPINVATLRNKNLYFSIRVSNFSGQTDNKLVHYTWYLEK